MEFSNGQTDQSTAGNSKIIIYMAKGTTNGQMVEAMSADGISIRCKEKASSPGAMEEATKAITTMTRSTEEENTLGQMADFTMGHSLKAKWMALVPIEVLMAKRDSENGPKASA